MLSTTITGAKSPTLIAGWKIPRARKRPLGWQAQNEVTQAYLESLPSRAPMRDRLEKLWNYERYDLPRKRGETYFYSHNDGLQNQSVLYKAASLNADRQVLIDPNTVQQGRHGCAGRHGDDRRRQTDCLRFGRRR